LDLGLGMSLFQIIFDRNPTPSRIELNSMNFEIGGLADFALSTLSDDPTINPLVAPLLGQVKIKGALDGTVNIALDVNDLVQSQGSVDLNLRGGSLVIDDPGLNIAEQKFEKFLVRAKMDRGNLLIDKMSGLESQGMNLALDGKIELKPVISTSLLNLNLSLKLAEGLKDNFGFIVDAAMGGQNGEAKMQILGSFAQPRTVTL
jgi:hypothetical protein